MSATSRIARTLVACVFPAAVIVGCSDGRVYTDLRVYSSPYGQVDWENDLRLKAQHHDHNGTEAHRILAYDAAGYDVIALMDYSGNPNYAYAWKTRRWPPEQWVPESLRANLASIKLFVPNAEEVGLDRHVTSPALQSYIELWDRSFAPTKQSWQYSSLPELFALIRTGGGLPCLAHPWGTREYYGDVSGTFCAEIYSAFAEARHREGSSDFFRSNRNANLVENWDEALQRNQTIFGIAVNDHFGPYATAQNVDPEVRDSGKIVVLTRAATLTSYMESLSRGSFFAVVDMNVEKDRYARVDSISLEATSMFVDTAGEVRWISGGREISVGPLLEFTALPPNARYVRAEVLGPESSVLYTQAFPVRPIGDVDGDYDIDTDDERICSAVAAATETDPLRVAACAAIPDEP